MDCDGEKLITITLEDDEKGEVDETNAPGPQEMSGDQNNKNRKQKTVNATTLNRTLPLPSDSLPSSLPPSLPPAPSRVEQRRGIYGPLLIFRFANNMYIQVR